MRAMVRRGMLFMLLVLCARAVSAQVPAIPADLQQAIRDRDAAVSKPDSATWDRLTTSDFTVVTLNGSIVTKAARLAAMRQQKATSALPAMPKEEVLKVYATSAVRRIKTNGTWVMELWVKEAQTWKVAAVQSTATE